MKIPNNQADLLLFSQEMVEACSASIEQRKNTARIQKNYILSGSQDGTPARYNRIFGHIDRLSSYLYSPANVRFSIDYERTIDDEAIQQGKVASTFLSKKFHKQAIDLSFAECIFWSLVHGSTFLKLGWSKDGGHGHVVQNYNLGAYMENLNSLGDQECFVHKTVMPLETVLRLVRDHPDIEEITNKLTAAAQERAVQDTPTDYFHEVVLSGLQPIQQTPTGNQGTVNVFGPKTAIVSPSVSSKVVPFNELWVMDDDRDDWTTIIYSDSGVFLEGNRVHRNLFLPGEQPFIQVTVNEQDGYLWGRSEVDDLQGLQDWLNERIEDVRMIMKRRAEPSHAYLGFSGVTEEINTAFSAPGGWIKEETPSAKIEEHMPPAPTDMEAEINMILAFFDDVAGFQNILSGRGEPGVRAGSHAQALMRTAAARLRDRALLGERQCAEVGDKYFSLLQAKDERPLKIPPPENQGVMQRLLSGGQTGEFLLSQIPDDASIEVDSHSASPAFQDDAVELAEILERGRAIDAEDFLDMIGPLLSPAMFDNIKRRLKEREASEAQYLQAHPDVALERAKHQK